MIQSLKFIASFDLEKLFIKSTLSIAYTIAIQIRTPSQERQENRTIVFMQEYTVRPSHTYAVSRHRNGLNAGNTASWLLENNSCKHTRQWFIPCLARNGFTCSLDGRKNLCTFSSSFHCWPSQYFPSSILSVTSTSASCALTKVSNAYHFAVWDLKTWCQDKVTKTLPCCSFSILERAKCAISTENSTESRLQQHFHLRCT